MSVFELATQQVVCCRQAAAAADNLTKTAEFVFPVVDVYYSGPLPLYNCSTPELYHCSGIGGAPLVVQLQGAVENKYCWFCQVVRTDRAACQESMQRRLQFGTVGLPGNQLESNGNA